MGLFDPQSPIRLKLLHFHAPADIDADWFEQKISRAFALRQPLFQTDTNSYRFIHGENDGMPGFIADVYAGVLVVKLYSLIWLPYLENILPVLQHLSRCETTVLRLSRTLQRTPDLLYGLYDGQILQGTLAEEVVIFKEHGLRFAANVVQGHKTGYFLDHRHNRKRVGKLSGGKTVLDVFAYAGGFSVHALAGGAAAVTSLDISRQALEMAQHNVALNFTNANHDILATDAFDGLAQLHRAGKRFDVVVVDPPSFAKKDSEREGALRSYDRLARQSVKIVAESGMLVLASCSSRVSADAFFAAIHEALPASAQLLEKTFHDIDHPIGFPEGAYLKCAYYRI